MPLPRACIDSSARTPNDASPPNIGLIPTPEGDAPNNDGLCAPAPTGDEQHIRGHRLVKIGDDEPEALLLDGELLRRTDAELADTGAQLPR